jgi:[ribosomal protein S5]-alanine N-acetyltransferase
VLLWYGFKRLRLNRIHAHSLVGNAASRRVLAKLGMKEEGLLRQHARIGTQFPDMVTAALLRQDWTDTPPRVTRPHG